MDPRLKRTSRRQRASERGLTIVELLVAMAVLTVVGAIAAMGLYVTTRAHAVVVPAAGRITVRARMASELRTAQDGAAEFAFFDLVDTIRPIVGDVGAGGVAKGESSSGAGDAGGSTGGGSGGGKDPGGSGGGTGGGGGGGGAAGGHGVPIGTSPVAGRYGWGTGVVVGNVPIVGPVAVVTTPLAPAQVGPAVISIRTAPAGGRFRLAERFISSSNRIRLAARADEDAARITALEIGDILYINGVTVEGEPVTALAEIATLPTQLPSSTYATPDGLPTMRYYELSVSPPGAAYGWGLANGGMAASGVTILSNASVCRLDRTAPVVSYYTARESTYARDGAPLNLYRAVGDPTSPASVERLADDVGAPLTASLVYESEPAGTPTPVDQQILSVGVPLVDETERANPDLLRSVLRLPARPSELEITILKRGGAR